MTLHIHYDNECKKCGVSFIPFRKDGFKCPKCGTKTDKYYKYIPKAAESICFNLAAYQSIIPGAWGVFSFGDHVLILLFQIFESYRVKKSRTKNFEEHLDKKLEKMKFGDQEYLKGHLREIALETRDFLLNSDNFREDFLEKLFNETHSEKEK